MTKTKSIWFAVSLSGAVYWVIDVGFRSATLAVIDLMIVVLAIALALSFVIEYLIITDRLGPREPGSSSPHTYSELLSEVDAVLTFMGLFLPARLMNEDAGDVREFINKLVGEKAPAWMIYTKLTSSVFWILLAAVREVLTVTKKKPN